MYTIAIESHLMLVGNVKLTLRVANPNRIKLWFLTLINVAHLAKYGQALVSLRETSVARKYNVLALKPS